MIEDLFNADDLTEDIDVEAKRAGGRVGRSLNLNRSPAHSDDSPAHSDASSPHLNASSPHLGGSSPHLEEIDQCVDPELLRIAEPVRNKGKVASGLVQETIRSLCKGRFLSLQHIAVLLNRSPKNLGSRFIKPMIDAGKLERRFPQQPNHELQAYRTRETK